VKTAIIGGALLVVGAIAIATGLLPTAAAVELWDRVWPILLFVAAITIVSSLAAEAGVFDALAHIAARAGRGRAWLLWLLVTALAALSTIFLSLDTTAVLLTPIVIVIARRAGLNPLPFALTTVWLANTASLLLPISNLTNLLAQNRLGNPTPLGFAALTWAPALVSIVLPAAVIFVIYRRSLTGPYRQEDPSRIADPVAFRWSAVTLALLIPLLVSGLPVWLPASVAALVLIVVFARRRPGTLRISLVPWQLMLFAGGLFLVIEAAHAVGLGDLLATVSGAGSHPADLLRLAGTGALSANIANNLPAYLALEPVADSPARVIALLIGVNVGPLITPWASLATLLWHERLRSVGVTISWGRYLALGLIAAPVVVAAATGALILMQ
jgi:Na+/H+ antiporter NhaD/arsenite permease-like protein